MITAAFGKLRCGCRGRGNALAFFEPFWMKSEPLPITRSWHGLSSSEREAYRLQLDLEVLLKKAPRRR